MNDAQPKRSYLKEATSLLGATLPLLGLNVAIYAAFFFVALIWFSVWIGMAILLGRFSGVAAVVCLIIAVGAGGWGWRLARRYLLYMVKGAHIAAMTEIMLGRDVPRGVAQISYGQEIIKKYFKDVSLLFGLDMLIDGIVRRFTRTAQSILNFLPLPQQARQLVALIRKIIERSASYVDEAILSYAIARQEENVFHSARQGLVLYAQSYKPILITTVKFYVVAKIFSFLVFFGFMIPALALSVFEIEWLVFGAVILAIVAARLVELALFEPFALAYVMVTFHRETEGKQPNPEWDQKLQGLSDKFKELVQKAETFATGKGKNPALLQPGMQVQPPATGGSSGL